MSETKIIKEEVDKDENWAVLPFDEEEDAQRWEKLMEETEQLEKDVAEFEATHGMKLLMNEPLPEVQTEDINKEFGELF